MELYVSQWGYSKSRTFSSPHPRFSSCAFWGSLPPSEDGRAGASRAMRAGGGPHSCLCSACAQPQVNSIHGDSASLPSLPQVPVKALARPPVQSRHQTVPQFWAGAATQAPCPLPSKSPLELLVLQTHQAVLEAAAKPWFSESALPWTTLATELRRGNGSSPRHRRRGLTLFWPKVQLFSWINTSHLLNTFSKSPEG